MDVLCNYLVALDRRRPAHHWWPRRTSPPPPRCRRARARTGLALGGRGVDRLHVDAADALGGAAAAFADPDVTLLPPARAPAAHTHSISDLHLFVSGTQVRFRFQTSRRSSVPGVFDYPVAASVSDNQHAMVELGAAGRSGEDAALVVLPS